MAAVLMAGVRALGRQSALALWAMSRPWRGPVPNGIVEGFEVDLHWPHHKLVAELDGYEYHGHQEPSRPTANATSSWPPRATAPSG